MTDTHDRKAPDEFTVDDWRGAFAALRAAGEWRPVTEPPDNPGLYLTHNGSRYDIHAWDGRRWTDSSYGRWPTHWRPLPPAPDEVQP